MRILCVGIESAQATAIAEAMRADLARCGPAELHETATLAPYDLIVIGGRAFAELPSKAAVRAATVSTTWMLLGDAAEDALYVGIDAVLDSDTDAEVIADEAWRAISSRRDALRWPKGFSERRVVVATSESTKLDAIEARGFKVTRASDAGMLIALRRVDHHAAIVDARATRGRVSQLVAAIRAYDPGIGIAAVVQTNDAVEAAREAGASVVRMGVLGGDTLAELAEEAWRAWCAAQPSPLEPLIVRQRGALGAVAELIDEAGYVVDGEGPEVLVVSEDEADEFDSDKPAILIARAQRGHRPSGRFVAELPPNVEAEELERAIDLAGRIARGQRTIAALGMRLHEMDARRVELLKRLADAQLEADNLATLDALTQSLNRRGVEDTLLREIELARRSGGTIAACLIEIDDDVGVHARYGYRTGDDIVEAVADRLQRALRTTDSMGRVGDDTFLLLLPQTRQAEAVVVAERARDAVAHEPVVIGAETFEVTLATGVAVLPWETQSLDDALVSLRDAVQRRRAATTPPGGTHDTMVDDLIVDTARLDLLLADLLSGEGLAAVAQPIVRVSDETVVGYEMLTRGREGLYETPQKLLHFARHRGKLAKVDMQCLETCLAEARSVADHLLVSVNLFPTTLLDLEVSELVKMFVAARETRLCLELSEEQFVGDPRELIDRLAAIRSAGVKLAIDDVGKGRGTLDSVMLLEPDIVKIDKELITGASRDTRKERLLRRLVSLAVTLGCEVVGEGVEKPDDLGLLRELDVPYAQGFLWAEPAKLESFPPEHVSSSPPSPSGA